MRVLAIAVLLSACGTFEEPSLVIDTRIIAMRTEVGDQLPPHADQVLDIDSMDISPMDYLEQLQTTRVIAWVADPGTERQLWWSMRACLPDDDGRCDLAEPHIEMGSAVIDDPDTSSVAQRPYAELIPSYDLVAMIVRGVQKNPVAALGGVDIMIELRIGGIDEPRGNDLIGMKALRISPRIPAQRASNTNPSFSSLSSELASNGAALPNLSADGLRCADQTAAIPQINAGDSVTLFPNEVENQTREQYIVPGLDGTPIEIEESVSYQWLATYGSWSDDVTGGGHDVLGNQSLLGSDWRAPQNLPDNARVSLWMIQRDERLGVTPWEFCVRVRR